MIAPTCCKIVVCMCRQERYHTCPSVSQRNFYQNVRNSFSLRNLKIEPNFSDGSQVEAANLSIKPNETGTLRVIILAILRTSNVSGIVCFTN